MSYLARYFLQGTLLALATFPINPGKALADEWVAAADASAIANPVAASAATTTAGAAIYKKRCESCHGTQGKGDGPDAADLSITPADLGRTKTQAQSDGALFWKIQTGKKPMPKYGTRMSSEEMWTVIHYVRTFAKKG